MSSGLQAGCSQCLLEAIQTHDEMRLRALLSSPATEFVDTFWAPVPRYFTCLYGLNGVGVHVDLKWEGLSFAADASGRLDCRHVRIDSEMQRPVEAGHTDRVAVSVLAMAMIFSTSDFNAFRIMKESGRFNLNETFVFHELSLHWAHYYKLEKCGELSVGSNSLELFHLISNAMSEANGLILPFFNIRFIDLMCFAIAADTARCDGDPFLTRTLFSTDAAVDSGRVRIGSIEKHFLQSTLFSNALAFNPTHAAYSGEFIPTRVQEDFFQFRSYLRIVELFAAKFDMNVLLNQRGIERRHLFLPRAVYRRSDEDDYYERENEAEEREIGPVDFLLPDLPRESTRELPFEEQANVVREVYRTYTRNGLTNSSLSFQHWRHANYYKCVVCRAIDAFYSSFETPIGLRFLVQLQALGFKELIRSLLGESRRSPIVQMNLSPEEAEAHVSVTFLPANERPLFSGIDWERCSFKYSDGMCVLFAQFSRFQIFSFRMKDELKAPIELLASAVQQLVDAYDSPLTLQQMARLVIREAVSGPQFEKRMRSLPLPPVILEFLLFADELLYS